MFGLRPVRRVHECAAYPSLAVFYLSRITRPASTVRPASRRKNHKKLEAFGGEVDSMNAGGNARSAPATKQCHDNVTLSALSLYTLNRLLYFQLPKIATKSVNKTLLNPSDYSASRRPISSISSCNIMTYADEGTMVQDMPQ